MNNLPFAEIIESSLSIWKAQCWTWNKGPSFGSLVTVNVQDYMVFGLVYEINTGSKDPSRTVMAYKKSEDELKKEQPQIFEFLCTTFSCLTLGYMAKDKIYYQLSSEPPKIHSFVSNATLIDRRNFFSNEHYLHLLFNYSSQISSLEELLLALLKQLSDEKILNQELFTNFTDTFSLLTANDYRRLKLFLQRAQPIVNY